MAGNTQTRVLKNKMEVITESKEEESMFSWKTKMSKKQMKEEELISYQSYKDEDISMEAVRERRTKIMTSRNHDDDNHQYDDADDSDNFTSSTGTSRTSGSSDDDDDDDSLDELNTSQTSSFEIKFEKEVDLFAENDHNSLDSNTGNTSIMSEYFHGEIHNGMLNGPMSPVSIYQHNGIFQNGDVDQPLSPVSDNRVSVLEVKQAVIETTNMVSPSEYLSYDKTDPGPEMKKVMLLETDIDSVAKIDTIDNGDYKVIGDMNDTSVELKTTSGSGSKSFEALSKTMHSKHEMDEYVNSKGDNYAGEEKAVSGEINENSENLKKTGLDPFDEKVEKMNRKNSAIIGVQNGKKGKRMADEHVIKTANTVTMANANGTQEIIAQSNRSMSGLRIDQYKISEKTETITTEETKKIEYVALVGGSDKGESKLPTKEANTNIVTQGSSKTEGKAGNPVDENDVTLRETKGRDMSKVRRELKLDIPNNNNNNKTALLDQLLLSSDMSQGIGVCCRCGEGFGTHQQIVNSNGEVWHPQCFVCAQCFQPFPEGIFYEYEGRKYCEHDFHVLFAPCCGKCSEFIVGRVIKAMNNAWHPDCFRCQLCTGPLADAGFVKNAGRALCRECNAKEKARGLGKYVCHKCHSIIEDGHIKYKGEAYHPYHFNCNNCGIELNADAREVNGELYCLRCHDKMGIPICGACRRPIEERVVHALGKAWHVEHFVCAKCEKPFFGTRHYEKKGLAYCEVHYHQLFGNICFVCNTVISGDVFHAFNKAWHVKCFACSICDRKMSQKTKFFEFDLKPVCKFCYEKFPGELKKRLKKAYEEQGTKK